MSRSGPSPYGSQPSHLDAIHTTQPADSGTGPTAMAIFGVDFTSRPCAHKPLTVAVGRLCWPPPLQPPAAIATHPASASGANPAPVRPCNPSTAAALATTTLSTPSDPRLPPPPSPPPPPRQRPTLEICRVDLHTSQPSLQSWLLTQPPPFVAALDFPFGQPRELVEALGWNAHDGGSGGTAWRGLLAAAAESLSREAFEAALRAFMAAQPPGRKHLRRRVAAFSREVSPMSLVRTPTAKMFHAGAVLLAAAADAGCHVAPHMPRRDVTAVSVAPAAVGSGTAAAIAPVTAGEGSAAGLSSISAERSGDGRVEAGGEGAAAVDGAVCCCGDARGKAEGGTYSGGDGRAGLRVLLEAYPALPARRVLGVGLIRDGDDKKSDGRSGGRGGGASTASAWSGAGAVRSYKSDSRGKAADPGRAAARKAICRALVGEVGAAAAAGVAAAVAEGKGAPATRAVGPDDATAACSAEAGPESVGQPPEAAPSRHWRHSCGSGRGRGVDRPELQSGGSQRSPPSPALAATAGHQVSGRHYSGEGDSGGGGGEAAAGGGTRAGGRVAGLAAAYGLESVVMAPEVLQRCEEDASGDTLDAVLAALQAAWAATLGPEGNWGAPEEVDPLEGWVTDPWVMEQYQLARNAGMNASHVHRQDYVGGSGTAASGGACEGATVYPSGQPAAAAAASARAAVLCENVVMAGISEPGAGGVGMKACGKRRRVARSGVPDGAMCK